MPPRLPGEGKAHWPLISVIAKDDPRKSVQLF